VNRAVEVGSMDGLDGVTIGRLAGDLEMSKAGVIGQFGSKEALQLAALDRASEEFVATVVASTAEMPHGLERLLAICDNWVDHVSRPTWPGGCFFTAISVEFDSGRGPVHDEVVARARQWRSVLKREVRAAVEAGDLSPDTDVDQVVFEIQAIPMGLNQSIQLFGDRRAAARARRAIRRILGLAAPS
jgi:AcrR family transcriptional regulator